MKTFIIAIIMAFCCLNNSMATETSDSTFTRSNNTFTAVKKSSSANYVKTIYKYKDTKGNEYPIYINKNTGHCVIKKISSKTGNEYNYYLPEEMSKQIAKELNIEYKQTKK